MKQLIEDATEEQFKAWAESVLSIHSSSHEETGFHRGPDNILILTQMATSEPFKHYLHSGFDAWLREAAVIVGNTATDETAKMKAMEYLHHSRITAGFMMGFKYAMYLHEQRALAQLRTKVTTRDFPDDYEFDK